MRILLQNRNSLLYVESANNWTSDVERATDFQQMMRALDFVWQTNLINLDILMVFGDPGMDIRIPASL
jgi:hypothetical protein